MTNAAHPLDTILASRIRSARRSMSTEDGRRASQQHLADRVGVHVITVSQWERGKSTPTVANLMAVADVTGQPMSYFTGDADDEEESERRMRELVSLLMERGQYDVASSLLDVVRIQVAHREHREVVA